MLGAAALACLAALAIASARLRLWVAERRLPIELRLARAVDRRFAKLGLPRRRTEGWRGFLLRAEASGGPAAALASRAGPDLRRLLFEKTSSPQALASILTEKS